MSEPLFYLGLPDIAAANDRHDREHGHPFDFQYGAISPGWKAHVLSARGPLTDRKIAKYEQLGYYSAQFRAARKELAERKAAKRNAKRDGNFDLVEGRMIYRPL